MHRRASAAVRVLQRSSSPNKFWSWGRVWDGLAIAVILFVAWRWFVAPRMMDVAKAYPAPHLTYAMLDGGSFALTQARGKVVFLDFWASWCEPCRLSLPLVEAFAKAHPEVEVVAVDVGEPKQIAGAYAAKAGLRNVALDVRKLSVGYFQIEGYPTMVVIDPQGRIRATWPGFNPAVGANMDAAAKRLSSGG